LHLAGIEEVGAWNKAFGLFVFTNAVAMAVQAAPNVNVAVAQCESSAYERLGVQTDRSAGREYLEKKFELVRVCLVGQGF
jgi:hypothetical protein